MLLRERHGLFCRGHRVIKPPRLGISGGERADKERTFVTGDFAGAFRELNRTRPVANARVRAGRQQPGQIVHGFGRVGSDPQRLVELIHGLRCASQM